MTTAQIIARLDRLSALLSRYAHRWGECPSTRMYRWVDEYNDLRSSNPAAWLEYCRLRGASPDHDAYDCLA